MLNSSPVKVGDIFCAVTGLDENGNDDMIPDTWEVAEVDESNDSVIAKCVKKNRYYDLDETEEFSVKEVERRLGFNKYF